MSDSRTHRTTYRFASPCWRSAEWPLRAYSVRSRYPRSTRTSPTKRTLIQSSILMRTAPSANACWERVCVIAGTAAFAPAKIAQRALTESLARHAALVSTQCRTVRQRDQNGGSGRHAPARHTTTVPPTPASNAMAFSTAWEPTLLAVRSWLSPVGCCISALDPELTISLSDYVPQSGLWPRLLSQAKPVQRRERAGGRVVGRRCRDWQQQERLLPSTRWAACRALSTTPAQWRQPSIPPDCHPAV